VSSEISDPCESSDLLSWVAEPFSKWGAQMHVKKL